LRRVCVVAAVYGKGRMRAGAGASYSVRVYEVSSRIWIRAAAAGS